MKTIYRLRQHRRNKYLRDVISTIAILGLATGFALLSIASAHSAETAPEQKPQTPPSYINLTPDHGLACPDGYRPVRVTSDLSDPVMLEGDAVLTYPATSGGMTCEQVRS